jgi:hypothetical protein
MQDLYDTVRAAGADNLVIAGGVGWAFDLSRVASASIQGYNIMYATHAYSPQNGQAQWDQKFGYLAAQDIAPVIATEFGDGSSTCKADWDTQLVQYADARQISWTAWAWWAGGCSFPALLSDWQYTPTVQGAAIKTALMNYAYQPAGIPSAVGGNGGAGSLGGASGSAAGGTSGASSSAGGGASGSAAGGGASGASGSAAGGGASGSAAGGASGSAGSAVGGTGNAGGGGVGAAGTAVAGGMN